MNNTNLLIIDSRILNIEEIKASIKEPNVKYVILDYYNDTFITLNKKIESLGIKKIESMGLLRHGYILPTYKLLDNQKIPSILKNVEVQDVLLNSWSEIRNFLLSLKFSYSLKNFDFLSCRLDKNDDYRFVFSRLEATLNINIRASNDDLGNIVAGGNWVLESDNVNIQDIYFNDNILNYKYLFYITTVTIKAVSFTKPYDGLYFNEPLITIDLPVLDTLSGTISYSGTYTTALNVGTYIIEPSGLSSTEYYINYENGTLTIIPTELSISINDYIKVYDGTNTFNDYVVNYSGLIDSEPEPESVLTGSLTISGTYLNAVNVGTYSIIPGGLSSNNYHITYDTTNLKIIPASLLVIGNNVGKIYDRYPYTDENTVFYDGFVNSESETASDLSGSLVFGGSFIGATNVGTYIIQPSGLTSNNYDIMFINGILTIYYDDFLVAANNFRKFYDNLFFTNPTLSYFHTVWDVSGYLIYSGTYETAKNIGSYTILANPTLNTSNYIISYFNGTLIIDKAEVKIKALPVNKIYDAIPYTDIPVTWEGLLGSDTSNIFIGNLLNIGTSYQSVNIGTYNIIPSGVETQNYTIIYDESILTINKAPLVLNTQFYSKIYDGNNIGYGDVISSISGIMNNENISIVSYDVRFHTNQAGYQFMDICNITLSGYTINNYYIVPVPVVTGLIEPRLLTAWYSSRFKPYNGLTDTLGLVGTLSGILGLDQVTISSTIANFRQETVGYHFIDISYTELWGKDSGNYIVKSITPIIGRIIQNRIIINWFGGHKIYDNNNNAKFTLSYTISGMIEEDNLIISNYTAVYKNRDVGEHFIDISNVIYSSSFLDVYRFFPIPPIAGQIHPKTIYPYFVGGDKIYDSELAPGPIVYTLSGIIGTQDVDISNWLPRYQSPNAGYNFINFTNTILSGFNSYNYILYGPDPIVSLITAKTLVATFYGGDKIYDSYTTASLTWSLSGTIGDEIVSISSFDANFKSQNVGSWYVDVSNINLQNINYVAVYDPFIRTISKREIVSTFYNGDKTYDSTFIPGPITYSLSGIVAEEIVTISSYFSKFQKNTVGYNLIDISDVIITSDNYYVKTIPPFISYINYRYLTTIISGGDKVYDKSNMTGPINIDLSNIVFGELLTISTYISRFKNVNSGIQMIDVSNLKITGLTVTNYKILPIVPINSEIYPKKINLIVSGGDKTYDGTTVLGRVTRITLSGMYPGDSISLLNTWYANFVTSNIGSNSVDISNIDLSGFNVLNYVGTHIPFKKNIFPKLLTIAFSNGNKIYDGFVETRPLSYDISGIVKNEIIDISSYVSKYRNKNADFQIIDISNVILSGLTSPNYIIRPINSISGIIYKKDLILSFNGGDKIYNGLLNTSLITGSISGQVGKERISLISFDSSFTDPNVGFVQINFSNLVLSSLNYYIETILPLYANIYNKYLNITFSGGTKIYDGSRVPGTINNTITGIENNEVITVFDYNALFSTPNAGRQRIDVSNIILAGDTITNYLINPIIPHYSTINKQRLVTSFFNGDKNYDGTTFTPILDYSVSGVIGSESIILTDWVSTFKSPRIGYQFIDISAIVFTGLTSNNYFLEPVKMIIGYISSIPISASFFGGSKIYDGTTGTSLLISTLSGIVNNEIITVNSFVSKYADPNAGEQRIDISNLRLLGSTVSNYYILPIKPITSIIYKKDITATFSGGDKIYDSTRYTGPLLCTTSGIIGVELITISTYISFFSNSNVGLNRIDVSNLIIQGNTVANYYLNPIVPHYSNITQKQLVISFNGGNKTYDGTRATSLLTNSISGIIGTEIILLSNYLSTYRLPIIGNQIIDISNVVIAGSTALNYSIKPIIPITGVINPRYITADFNGGTKIYNGTRETSPLSWILNNIVPGQFIDISSYISLFNNKNVGLNRIDISNVILTGITSPNYIINPIIPIYASINKKQITATFNGGDKIYDGTIVPSLLSYNISGNIQSDILNIDSFNSFYNNKNVGLNRIDISDIILSGDTVPNYELLPVRSIYKTISKRPLIFNFYGGNKIYDRTTVVGSYSWDFDNIILGESISGIFIPYYNDYNNGFQKITISNLIISSNNYYVEQLKTISAFIHKRNIDIVPDYLVKTYNAVQSFSLDNPFKVINGILEDNLNLFYYTSRFKNIDAGYSLVDISNIILGGNITNYILNPTPSLSGYILPKTFDVYFNNKNKIYDDLSTITDLSYSIVGIFPRDNIKLISYEGRLTNQNVGTQRIDISNLVFDGLINNYILNMVISKTCIISQKGLHIIFSGGDKTYDTTTSPGNSLTNTISGVIPNTNVNILYYDAKFNSPNIGYNRIDISNLTINNTNYFVNPIRPIYANINQESINIYFTGGNKIYDGTTNVYDLSITSSTPGISLFYYNASFLNSNAGLNYITITNYIINGVNLNNYNIIANTTISAFIFPKPITINFSGGNKKYNGTLVPGLLSSTINGLITGENINIQNYNAHFRNKNVGFQQIDISNIILSDASANPNNYVINSYTVNNALISKTDISGILLADNKNYDGTTSVLNPRIIFQNIYGLDDVFVNSFTSVFDSPLCGLQKINTSNVVLGGLDANNYNISILPINRSILPKILTINFSGGSKIYDGGLETSPLSWTISGLILSEIITLISYNSKFLDPNVGIRTINIKNLIFLGRIANYIINSNYQILAEIIPKPLNILYINKNKIYDGTQNLIDLNLFLVTNENISISSFIGLYKSYDAGNTFIDISNVILTNYNYTVTNIQSEPAIIYKKPINVSFYNGNKIYDGTTNYYGSVSSTEIDSSLISYDAKFSNKNVGVNFVSISNLIVINNNNYQIIDIPTISANIFPKVVSINFKAYDKIYNNNTNANLYNPIINGLVGSDINGLVGSDINNNSISVLDWIANYDDKYVGNNKNINIQNIILSSLNYVLNNELQTASGMIVPNPVIVVAKSANKIYDKTVNTSLLSWTISGVYSEDLSGVIFNYNEAMFMNPLTANNKQVILSEISISGNLSYNYNLLSYIATGDITKKPIDIKFTGQNKIYDNTISAIVYNPILYGTYDDIVVVNNYNSNFINYGVGINKLINIKNITLTGVDSFNYSANDSSANANIIYPTKINLNIANNTWTYKDLSNNVSINYEPVWAQEYITNIIDIFDNIIITSDGKILNNNVLVVNTNLPLNRIRNNIISSINQLLITTNNWSSYTTTNYPNNIVSFSNNFVISSNQIYKSGNLIYTDVSSNFVDIESVDSNNIFIITNNKFILTSNNGGISFIKQQITNVSDNFISINMFDIYNGYIIGENGLILRTNDGTTWTKLNSLTNNKLNTIYNINSNEVIVGGDNGLIITSSNRGITWSVLFTGTNENILNISASSFTNIKAVCSNNLLLTYSNNLIEGNLKLYDNQTLLFDSSVNIVYNFTNFPVKKYWLNALFTPTLVNSYSIATTPIRIQNIKPIYYYDSYLTDILFSTNHIGLTPFVDQSGGTFSIIGNNLISINNTGNIIFSNLIPVGRYNFISIYTLASVSSQQTHQLIVRPNIIYQNSNIQIDYGTGLELPRPNVSPIGGLFTISGNINNFARIDISSGIFNIISRAELGDYNYNIIYNVNNISNSARLNISVLSNFGYIPSLINLDYLSGGKSVLPYSDPSGGIFTLQDISSSIVRQNKVSVNSKGILTFTNTIDVGFYYFKVLYRNNYFIYSINSSPYIKYTPEQNFINYFTNADVDPVVQPSGGTFSSSNLINLVNLNSTTGKLTYNSGIDVSSYYFNIKYEYNNGFKTVIQNLVVKPYINYYINYLELPYDVSGSSIIPDINPVNGIFTLLELDNILVQLNNAYIKQNGQIVFSNKIPVGIYNFNVRYIYNSIVSLFPYQLRIIPTIYYNINTLTINYDSSSNSILPIVQPSYNINSLFTISSIIQSSKININLTTGRIIFNKEIPVGNYNISVKYTNNNLSNTTNYLLNVIPNIYYRNNNSIINYRTLSRSERPYINPIGGTFSSSILDLSSNNILDLSNNNIFDLDSSGSLIFNNNLNVGRYNLLVNYTFNGNVNRTPYYLTVRPNISLVQSVYETYYDTSNNINISDINVDQSGGIISLYDISGSLVSSNYVTQNIIYSSLGINVGMYRVGILYQLNNTFNTSYYDIVIRPRIYYTLITELPYVAPNNGTYSIEDISNNAIIFSNGQINFKPNMYVGSYYYKVNYNVNNIISSTIVNLIVLPIINYNINSLTILYDSSGVSIAPYVNPTNGIFSSSGLNINSNGVISFSQGDNYNIGTNNFIINYSVNNITNTTVYNLIVKPIIYYTNNTSIINYSTFNNSSMPYYQQKGGLFEIVDYIGSLVETNNVSIDNSGIILFNNSIDVGIYSFIIKYTLQNLSNTTLYNLTVNPVIYYTNNTLSINYQTIGNSELPIALQPGGLFSILQVNDNILIDSSGIIYCTNQLDVGLYTLNISYTVNNLVANTIYYLTILPTIRYPSLTRILDYQTSGTSTIPIANPSKGFYSLSQIALINSGTGQLTFNNIDVGKYILPVLYTYNGVTASINFNLIINPILIYPTGITTLLYNHEISYSEKPTYLQKGGVFEISNNLFDIDNSGIVMFDKFINVGKYYFDIKYTLANVFAKYTYLLNIIPNIDLNYNYIELEYTNVFSDNIIPYVDQSGGTFTFEDISGSLINNLDVNYENGTFNLSNTVDVNLYTIKVIYSYNNTSNFTLFTLNIKPIYYYSTDNFTTIYNSNKYSIQPFVNQSGGSFSIITNHTGLFIDNLTGIINFGNDLEIGNYSLILKYTLRNTYNITNYLLNVIPIVDYSYPYFISEYNTVIYTPEAIYDPVGGIFTIQGASADLSANIIINNLITTNAISINTNNGSITFDSSIPVGLYLLQVNYNIGNTFNSIKVSYTMKPYLLYDPGSNRVPYHDISYSVMPIFAPPDGVFVASVPRINLIYTGISIDKNNGIIRFGLINAGFWTITVKYTVNGVSNSIAYSLQILANVYYNPPYSVIPFNSTSSTLAPIAKVLGGIYTLQEQTSGVSINSNTGILTFSFLPTGIYYIPIVYTVFGSSIVINYTVLVKPILIYNPDIVNAFYTNPTTSTAPLFNPPDGKFSIATLLPSIQIDASNGIISSTGDLRVGSYELNVSYLSNSSEEIIPYIINIYPILSYSQGSIITTYGSDYFTEKPFVNPKRGVFTSLDPRFYVDSSGGVIEIKNTNNVGKYIVPIQYKYNNMSVYSNYNIIINPLLKYGSTLKEMIYGYQDSSVVPIAKESLGTFYINSLSGLINIQTVYTQNQNTFNNFGVVLNGYSGLLNFGSNIKVGKYKFDIKYAISDLSSNQIYNLIVYPNVYYTLSSLILDYNTTGITSKPFIDQSGGYFTVGNIIDYKNEANKININNTTGIINFYKGISVGLYNFNIKYELNKVINYAKYNLIIRPNYYYLNDTFEVIYGSIGYSDVPFVLTQGGKFYIEDYDILDEYSISINENTGIVNINLVSINKYNIKLKYSLFGSDIFTNIQIIVKPYINYAKGSININYGLIDYSEIPFGLEKFGTYSFDNIEELNFQKSKVTIDASNGQIYFGDYINVGTYNLSIKYTVNQISNTFNYVLNIKPYLAYSVSGIIINYNIFTEKYILDLPSVVPTKGLFYFNDSSGSFMQSNISLDKNTGEINLYNRIIPNNYNLLINYYLKNIFNQYTIKLQVLPNYSFNNINFNYDISNIITELPYIDPSGGIFEIIQPIDINLYSKVSINNNGSLNINKNINIGTWKLGLSYSKIKSSIVNIDISVKPTVRYLQNYLNVLNGTISKTEIPYISPFGGIFELENTSDASGATDASGAITIDSNLGIVTVGILNIGIYNFNIKYTYNTVTTVIPFTVYVLFLFNYDISGLLINYNYSGVSQQPVVDIYYGLFSIPNNYKNIGINIDGSSGILSFSNNLVVNNYIIPVTYRVSNLFKINNYLLTVQPYILYDISNIEINYLSLYKSSKPVLNPKSGTFTINLEPSTNSPINIDTSGQFIISGLNINKYNLVINYKYNGIINKLIIKITSKPTFYYTNNNITTIYNNIFYSGAPTISPLLGKFSILENENTNTSINENTGIINFDNQLDVGKYVYNIGYTVNNITSYLKYYVKQIPYLSYNNEITNIIAGTTSKTNIPVSRPYGGIFRITNNTNNNTYIDSSGIIYFSDNYDIEVVNINVNYSFNDISSNYILVKNMIPSIYYPIQLSVGNSITPIKNRDYGKFYINFEPQTYIQTNKISIDSSSGIVNLQNDIDIGKNFFYVKYYKNKLETVFKYNFIINPLISYPNVNVNQTETTILTPTLNPLPGIYGNIYLLSNYSFVSLISSKTGELNVITAPSGIYNINVLYVYKDVSSNANFNITVKAEFYYNKSEKIIYGNTGESEIPFVSQSGGTYNINSLDIPDGLFFDTDTGKFSFTPGIEVGNYNITVYYILDSISIDTIFNFSILPFINYDNFYTVEYGLDGESFQPTVIPSGGTFQLASNINGISIDESLGNIYTTTILKVNTYELNINYTYNNVIGTGVLILYIIPKTVVLQIELYEKIYDGKSNVKIKSNKLTGIINNDKVFIKNTYVANFISPNVANFVPVYLSNLELGGPDSNNYIVEDSATSYGNISYITYKQLYYRINKGTSGNSSAPLVSKFFNSPSFLIKNPVNGVTISPYGIINWNNTLNLGIYNLNLLVYNDIYSFELEFTIEVTTNLYESDFIINNPIIENTVFESSKYNLRYNDTTGKAYVIETNEPALLVKQQITAYDENNLLNHDLNEFQDFYFNLPNADISDSLSISELNDDGTINPMYIYDLKWFSGIIWKASLRYLSDFNIQNNNILVNNPPTFNLPSGIYFSILQIIISGLPTSKIYYTLDGSDPTIDSLLYKGPITINVTKTIKAFVITPGYVNSGISSVTYEINYIPCILSNTLVKTPDGYEFIDNLKIGDLVVNSLGQEVPIKNILKYYIENPKERELPIIVPKDFFGINIPNKETYITENHAILIKNNKWLLGYHNLNLFNKLNIKPLYYNIELPNYFNDHLVINNMNIESWCARKYKYKYTNKTQEIINNKKVIVLTKNKI